MPLINKTDTYEIHYDSAVHRFYAVVNGERVAEGETEKEAEEFAKKLTKRQFKRIPVFQVGYRSLSSGEITSCLRDHYGLSVWFVHKGTRTKERLGGFYQATPSNSALAEDILRLQTERETLDKEIGAKLKGFGDPITQENIFALVGIEKSEEG